MYDHLTVPELTRELERLETEYDRLEKSGTQPERLKQLSGHIEKINGRLAELRPDTGKSS
jgi:chaperonin cofactor prefoldin